MTSCTHAGCVPTSITTRRIQPLEEGGKILLRRPKLPLRQRFPLQTQNAVVAPLVPRSTPTVGTVEIAAKLTALMLFSGARCCRFFRIQLFLQLSHQFCQHFLRIPLHWAPRLRPLGCRFTLFPRIAMLLQGRCP